MITNLLKAIPFFLALIMGPLAPSHASDISHSIEQDSSKDTDKKTTIPRILFLCTGNSCRSQMAEGWARHLGKDHIQVKSAGIKAHGLNPRAVQTMKEKDIDITAQTSKVVTPDMVTWASLVVTVCGDADEHCPRLPKGTIKIHWPLVDPARATGTEDEIMTQFRSVSQEIHQRVSALLALLKEKDDKQ